VREGEREREKRKEGKKEGRKGKNGENRKRQDFLIQSSVIDI
jgi:hypothetical protein